MAEPSLAVNAERHGRDETELLNALTKALAALVRGKARESTLRESFVHAMVGLGAEKGVLVQVNKPEPPDVEILYATGLSADSEAACNALRSSPGISPRLIRNAIEAGKAQFVENSQVLGLEQTPSLRGQPFSVLCAPVTDSLTSAPIAVLYFQNQLGRAFGSEDFQWLTAYAAALGHVLTLHLSAQRSLREPQAVPPQELEGPEIVGNSQATRQLVATMSVLLPSTMRSDAPPILVTGESGTGKELVARYLHRFSPKRARGPFQSFNCAGLRGDLAEARLFGHVRGAFTGAVSDAIGLFAAADQGTLFLDEIGEIPTEDQALLLRVLESRCVQPVGGLKEIPVDVQLILATNRKLEEEVTAGRFREDLYYRISALRLELAPLRTPARIADIPALLAFYVGRHERLLKKKTMGLTPAACRALFHFSWPGNVRQLDNVCLTLVTHAPPESWIDVTDIERLRPEVLSGPKNPHPEVCLQDDLMTYRDAVRSFRRRLIAQRLKRHGGNVTATAASLGISRPTFHRYRSEGERTS